MRNPLVRLVQRDPEKPTLRQRAAALKATAARVIRRNSQTAPALAPSSEQAIDWHDAPPGFMASPAIEPRGFRRTFEGIEDELRRLHDIALADYARRTSGLRERLPEEMWREEERKIREGLHLSALTAAVDPDSSGALALAALETGHNEAGSDAELIALGQQFEEARAVWMATVPASDAAHDRVEAFRQRAVAGGMDELAAVKAAWLQDGVNVAHEAEEEAFQALEPLNEAIMALPAHTVEGLAVKARAAIVALWPEGSFEADRELGDKENWERRIVRDLIDACVTLARRQAVGGL